MIATGLPPPPPMLDTGAKAINIGGIMPVLNVAATLEQQRRTNDALFDQQQGQAVIAGLAGHIKNAFQDAEDARTLVEDRMVEAMYCRRGEYTPTRLAKIREQNQPAIYMMLGAAKMRQVGALVRDALLGAGTEKPWTIRPTPVPELPPFEANKIVQALTAEVELAMMNGFVPSVDDARLRVREMKDQILARLNEEARVRCERMEHKMEDQLVEGGFLTALDAFITDLETFPTAFLGGPFVRKKKRLVWDEQGQPVAKDELVLEWERVDPFEMYPARWAKDINDGPLIRRTRLSRTALLEMIGVEGNSEPAIRKVIQNFGTGGYHDWLSIDSQREAAEGKINGVSGNYKGLMDTLMYWGSASGQMLLDWGMEADKVPDPEAEYQIEAVVVGGIVIRAVLNADPLARRPFYASSFQLVPGSVWGNSPYDLLKDCQDMCNAAARALAANMGVSSGPQVAVIANRIPQGEDITEMFPWKIWQFESDPMGSTAAPIQFFQPQSNANELMAVYRQFSDLADEYTGIPKYTTGLESAGGAGRTASGMSMMLGSASKIIKQVIGGVDVNILTPLLERLYYYNMVFSDDPDLKGDVRIVARGALSLMTKETAQVRVNEMLQSTANPIDMQIIGLPGRAELLRQAAKRLDINPERLVPPDSVLKQRQMEQMLMQQQQLMLQNQQQKPQEGGSGQELMDGTPTTDNFQPA